MQGNKQASKPESKVGSKQGMNTGGRPVKQKEFADVGARILACVRRAGKRGLTAHELADRLRLGRRRDELFRALSGAVRRGELTEKRGRFACADAEKPVTARIVSVKAGFGFASEDDGGRDVFIPGRALLGALPGDTVLLQKQPAREGGLPEGEVLRIVSECALPFTGVFEKHGSVCQVLPDKNLGTPVRVSPNEAGDAKSGDKVLVHITKRGENHYDHRAAVERVFGSAQSAAACCEAILAGAGVVAQFPQDVLQQAETMETHGIALEEAARRLDLRGEPIFTIDGADTKDIDDAVSLSRTKDGWALGVHIADVSHYVRTDSVLDAEAYERGTSVYYAQSVVPMLPPALSNGICSLNPQEDRLAFSALLSLSPDGELQSYRFAKTLIRSRVKGVYAELNALYAGGGDAALKEKYAEVLAQAEDMRTLATLLGKRRSARGGLNLESAETKIVIGPDGQAVDVLPRTSGVSENIIEELMLTANEAAARFAQKHIIPFVYRVHENPPAEKLETLCTLLDRLGISCAALKNGTASCGSLSKVLEAAHEKGLEAIVNHQLLRSMAKAKYSPENKGHYGLVLENYAHFTSPIRRYPDLAIHRILSEAVAGADADKLTQKYTAFANEASEQSSKREVRSMTVERDCESCYKAEYMRGHLGEAFEGIISGVSARGVFVRLPSTVEGFVRLEELPAGSYDCDGLVELRETLSGMVYRVGMALRVVAAAADVSSGRVDFALAKPEQK